MLFVACAEFIKRKKHLKSIYGIIVVYLGVKRTKRGKRESVCKCLREWDRKEEREREREREREKMGEINLFARSGVGTFVCLLGKKN